MKRAAAAAPAFFVVWRMVRRRRNGGGHAWRIKYHGVAVAISDIAGVAKRRKWQNGHQNVKALRVSGHSNNAGCVVGAAASKKKIAWRAPVALACAPALAALKQDIALRAWKTAWYEAWHAWLNMFARVVAGFYQQNIALVRGHGGGGVRAGEHCGRWTRATAWYQRAISALPAALAS